MQHLSAVLYLFECDLDYNRQVEQSLVLLQERGNLYPHITIIQTGGGKNDFKKFHITTEAENSEVKINYFYNPGQDTLYYDGLNYADFPSHRKQAINAHLGDLSEADNRWHEIALAFCNRIGATVTEDIELAGPSGIE